MSLSYLPENINTVSDDYFASSLYFNIGGKEFSSKNFDSFYKQIYKLFLKHHAGEGPTENEFIKRELTKCGRLFLKYPENLKMQRWIDYLTIKRDQHFKHSIKLKDLFKHSGFEKCQEILIHCKVIDKNGNTLIKTAGTKLYGVIAAISERSDYFFEEYYSNRYLLPYFNEYINRDYKDINIRKVYTKYKDSKFK